MLCFVFVFFYALASDMSNKEKNKTATKKALQQIQEVMGLALMCVCFPFCIAFCRQRKLSNTEKAKQLQRKTPNKYKRSWVLLCFVFCFFSVLGSDMNASCPTQKNKTATKKNTQQIQEVMGLALLCVCFLLCIGV